MSQQPQKVLTPAEWAELLGRMRHELPRMIEFETIKAKLMREKFLALKSAGFTDQQALDIVKSQPIL